TTSRNDVSRSQKVSSWTTSLARSAVSFGVLSTGPGRGAGVAEAPIPTYTLDARNSGFKAVGRSGMSMMLSVVAPGRTSAATPKAHGPVYTESASESKYTWKVT